MKKNISAQVGWYFDLYTLKMSIPLIFKIESNQILVGYLDI